MNDTVPPDRALDEECRNGLAASLKEMSKVVELVYGGLMRHKTARIGEAAELLKRLGKSELALSQKLISVLGDEEPEQRIGWAADLRELIGHVGRITRPLEHLGEAVSQKIKKGVLFSDKAVRELKELFEATRVLLVNAGDGLVTRNPTLKDHIERDANKIFRLLTDYATEHEERLVRGICSIEAGSLFLEMLDQFRSLTHHAKETVKSAGRAE